MVTAQWWLHSGDCKVVTAQWWLQSSDCTVVIAQWWLHSGDCKVVTAKWWLYSGDCTVVIALWWLQSGDCTVATAKSVVTAQWREICVGCTVVTAQWWLSDQNASFGAHNICAYTERLQFHVNLPLCNYMLREPIRSGVSIVTRDTALSSLSDCGKRCVVTEGKKFVNMVEGFLSSPVTGLEWPRGFQEVKVPRFHDNSTGWW